MEYDWSVPEPEVLERARERIGEGAVLATVVAVEGSAYRRPGAKLLLEAGTAAGSVTAGCLEDRLHEVAGDVRETGESRLVSYDLRGDGEEWGIGVGCNGVIDVLLEPVDERLRPGLEAVAEGRDVAGLVVLDDDGPLDRGDRAWFDPERDELVGSTCGSADAWPLDDLADAAGELAARGRAARLGPGEVGRSGRDLDLVVDGLAAPPKLVVIGDGPDVGPVVDLARRNGFRVTVVGFRGGADLDERFPEANETATTSPADLGAAVALDDRTYAVVMSHNFVDDRLALPELLDSPVPYVGLLGPRERFERMREAFADEGVDLDGLDRLHTPAGLDLGSGSPYGIAHSIVAELLAVANDRDPRHLADREGPIHDRVDL